MAANIKILLRLYRQYAKMDLLWSLRDMKYCLLQVLSCLLYTSHQRIQITVQQNPVGSNGYLLYAGYGF